ncbi:MAG TPA: xanthine dehydrogenase family protein molybdopterin-binding subunit [Actinomycetota bacterium]
MAERGTPSDRWVGAPLPRREDARFVTGRAVYVDDIGAPGALHLGFVRSPFAHARIDAIDASDALGLDGVAAVVTADDIRGALDDFPIATAEGCTVAPVPLGPLADGTARYVGEPVAAVLAADAATLEDAIELVRADLDPLPAVGRPEDALRADVVVHDVAPDNVIVRWRREGGDVDGAFAAADVVVRQRFRIPRLVAAPIEPRRALATYDADADALTLRISSQDPHRPLANLAHVLRRPRDRTRVIVPDVGGAFGSKGPLPPEAALAALLAIRTGRPVRWVETRSENFLSAYQGRGLEADVELAARADGEVLAVRARLIADMGAYLQPTSTLPAVTTAMLMAGTYAIPAARIELLGVATHKVPVGPYRGAGRPEAALLVERMMDLLAADLAIDPVELRHRNVVQPDAFPHRTPLGFVYDSGDYGRALRLACEGLGASPTTPRVTGRSVRATGVAMYVERVGGGAAPGPAALSESAVVSVEPDGRLVLRTGSSAHGQGHETTFAQIVADVFGVHPDEVDVRHGDSRDNPTGVGTFASRSVTIGGSAALIAAERVRERALAVAAEALEVSPDDLEWVHGRARVRGAPERSLGLVDLAAAADASRSADAGERLRVDATFTLPGPVFPAGAYAAEVEIDLETGLVRVVRVVGVDDAGRIVNPLLAHGQVQGGIAQGFGEAIGEEMVHDDDAVPLVGSLVDYAVPSAPDVPPIEASTVETPSPWNPLGAKGIGEGGAIGTPAAIANAVCRALAPFGVRHLDLPFTPERVLTAIRSSERLSRASGGPSPSGTAR